MSTPLAVATVTAVLQNFLQNSVTDLATVLGGPVTVSTEPPDRIDIGVASPDRINLFLFQATENQGWRNVARLRVRLTATQFPILTSRWIERRPSTAYGAGPLHAEVLLGQAMFVLHEMPVLTRDAIRNVSATPPPPCLLAWRSRNWPTRSSRSRSCPRSCRSRKCRKSGRRSSRNIGRPRFTRRLWF